MGVWNRFGIRQKNVAAVSVLLLLVAALITSVFIWSQWLQMTKYLSGRGESLAQIAAFTSRLGVVFEDAESVENELEGLLGSADDVDFCLIYDQDGELFAAFRPERAEASRVGLELVVAGEAETAELFADQIMAVVPITDPDTDESLATLVLRMSKLGLRRDIGNAVVIAVVAAGLALAAGIVVFWLISARIVGSLNLAVGAADRLARGDLTVEIAVESGDEVGRLMLAIREMVAYFSDMAEVADRMAAGDMSATVEPRSESDRFGHAFKTMLADLRSMVGELKTSSADVADSVRRISDTTASISAGARSQSAATETAAATVEEMAAGSRKVAQSAASLAERVDTTTATMGDLTSRVARSSEALGLSVEETAQTIEEMTASIKIISERIKVVDQVSDEAARTAETGSGRLTDAMRRIQGSGSNVGEVVEIIVDIADQANFLALNAAVQAARAGEAGRGFSVVANEVKLLAERTKSAISKVSSFVETVQSEANEAGPLVEEVLGQIKGAAERTSDLVGEVLAATQEQEVGAAQILEAATRMQEITRSVVDAVTAQTEGTEGMLDTFQGMDEMAKQFATASLEHEEGGAHVVDAAHKIAAIAQEHLRNAELLSEATSALTRQADTLQTMADNLRV